MSETQTDSQFQRRMMNGAKNVNHQPKLRRTRRGTAVLVGGAFAAGAIVGVNAPDVVHATQEALRGDPIASGTFALDQGDTLINATNNAVLLKLDSLGIDPFSLDRSQIVSEAQEAEKENLQHQSASQPGDEFEFTVYKGPGGLSLEVDPILDNRSEGYVDPEPIPPKDPSQSDGNVDSHS